MQIDEATHVRAPIADQWDSKDHPWRRYGGRTIDISLFGFLLSALLMLPILVVAPDMLDWLVAPAWPLNYLLLVPLAHVLSSLATAFCIARWGSTPGKWLFGLKVTAEDGGRLSLGSAMLRELHLLWWGLGLGLVPVSLFMLIRSFAELESDHRSRWDARVGSQVSGRAVVGWQHAGVIAGVLIVIALKALDLFDRLSPAR